MKATLLCSIVYFLFTVCILLHPVVFIVGTILLLSALFISLLSLVLMAESESLVKKNKKTDLYASSLSVCVQTANCSLL